MNDVTEISVDQIFSDDIENVMIYDDAISESDCQSFIEHYDIVDMLEYTTNLEKTKTEDILNEDNIILEKIKNYLTNLYLQMCNDPLCTLVLSENLKIDESLFCFIRKNKTDDTYGFYEIGKKRTVEKPGANYLFYCIFLNTVGQEENLVISHSIETKSIMSNAKKAVIFPLNHRYIMEINTPIASDSYMIMGSFQYE